MNDYIKIARLGHWFKNVSMLPRMVLALVIFPDRYEHLFY
jgi:hypothetical protein